MARKFLMLGIIALLLNISFVCAFDYVFGDTMYPYSTQVQPAKGASYTDSVYHTNITRITNALTDRGTWGTTSGYSTWDPQSSDGNYLVFMNLDALGIGGGGGYVLYNATNYQYIRNLDPEIQSWNSQDPEPRWDKSGNHPSWLYYRKDKQLRYLDVADGTDNLVHDFTSDFPTFGSSYYIYNGEEGTPSDDARYWAFMLRNGASPYQTVRVFVYDQQTNSVVSSKDVTGNDPNNVVMSKGGNYVYIAYDWTGGGNEFDGPHSYTRSLTNPVKICSSIPHAVPAFDQQGNEVMFIMNTAGNYGDHVMFVRLSDGEVFPLYDQANLGWDGSNVLHTAPNFNKRGWGVISTYSLASDGGNNHWSDNQLFMFELDENKTLETATPPRILRLSFTQNLPGDDYYYNQPNAQMNSEGTKIWWGSNWRNTNGRMEIYQLTLPITWWEDLAGVNESSNQTTYHEADLNTNNYIELNELMNYIAQFKLGSVTRVNVLEGLMNFFKGRYN